jgi:hypothetical protein
MHTIHKKSITPVIRRGEDMTVMSVNKEKLKQLIHYIIHKCQDKPDFGKTVLYKLMYFSDFNHYEIYEKLITDETYIKKQYGPVPSHFNKCYTEHFAPHD